MPTSRARASRRPVGRDGSRRWKFLSSVRPDKPAPNIPALLSTGIFEGIPVTYKFSKHNVELPGFIKDQGYACGCSGCNYSRVLTALEFEKHAVATSKHQNNHIFLPNGKTLHAVIKELEDVPLNGLGPVVARVIGCKPNFERYEAWKRSFRKSDCQLDSTDHGASESDFHPLKSNDHAVVSSLGPILEESVPSDLDSIIHHSSQDSALSDFLTQEASALNSSSSMINNLDMMDDNPGLICQLSSSDGTSPSTLQDSLVPESLPSCLVQNSFLKGSEPCNQTREMEEKMHKSPCSILEVNISSDLDPVIHHLSEESIVSDSPIQESFTMNTSSSTAENLTRTDSNSGLTCQVSYSKEMSLPATQQDPCVPENSTSLLVLKSLPKGRDSWNQIENKERGKVEKKSRATSSSLHLQCYTETRCSEAPQKSVNHVRKKRGNDLHQLIFKDNCLPDGSELVYCSRKGKVVLKGYKLGCRIKCGCCNNLVSPSQFEAHAGFAARRQPYHNIYTSNGSTLHELSISLSKGESFGTICNEEECSLCGDSGELVLCDGCPKAFHAECLGTQQRIPDCEWYCPYCKDGLMTNETYLSGSKQHIIRVRRILEVPTTEIGGCAVCRSPHYSLGVFNSDTVMLCDQCEKEYHVGCLRAKGICDLKELPRCNWFCCLDCSSVHSTLQNRIFNGAVDVPKSMLNIIRKKTEDDCTMDEHVDYIQWQLLSGKIRTHESKLLLSKAAAIFRNGFSPVVGPYGCDLVPAMIYGRSVGGQDFVGMYCAILTVGSLVVTAGILRIFGKEVAELPLIATARQSRGKGYCRCLVMCVERFLSRLGVENLVLPAAEDAESMWIQKFGFTKIPPERLMMYSRELQITMFAGTSMLEKSVTQGSYSLGNNIPID